MLGLAIGSWAGGRSIGWLTQKYRLPPLFFYGLAEAVIGVGAFTAPQLMKLGKHILLSTGESNSVVYLLLSALARARGARPGVVIRVNPDVGAGGHAKISTGTRESKFGVSLAEAERLYALASADPHLNALGVACHIGSQITDMAPLARAFGLMRALVERLRARGLAVERLDLGGGLGVPYFNQPDPPTPMDFAAMASAALGGLEIALAFEPGRVIAANAGVLVSRVIHVHERPEGRRFLVLDAAMNDLIRPAMYDAYHDIRPVRPRGEPASAYDVVGPVCETGDTFTRDRLLPPLAAGDLVAFMSAGAYGAVMSSEYNSRPLIPEVLVKDDAWAVVRPRPSYEAMLAREPAAPWLSASITAATWGKPR